MTSRKHFLRKKSMVLTNIHADKQKLFSQKLYIFSTFPFLKGNFPVRREKRDSMEYNSIPLYFLPSAQTATFSFIMIKLFSLMQTFVSCACKQNNKTNK